MAEIQTIADGDLFSISRLARITGLDRRTVTRRLATIRPAGERAGHPVYSLNECGPTLFGGAALDENGELDPSKMQPADRDKWFASEIKRRDLQVRDGQLLEVDDVEMAVSTAFASVAQAVFALPDYLERRAGLSPEQAEICQAAIYEMFNDLAERLGGFMK